MELAFIIYLVEIFQKMSTFSGFGLIFAVTLFCVAFCLISLFVLGVMEVKDETVKNYFQTIYEHTKKPAKIFVVVALVGHGVSFLSPTKETSYTMLAAYGIQTVAESEQATTILGKSSKVLEQYMDQYLKESEEVKKEVEEKVSN